MLMLMPPLLPPPTHTSGLRTHSRKTNETKRKKNPATKNKQFIGDIGQPLHVEAYEVGGNEIDAVCGGKKTNLHAVRVSLFFSPCLSVCLFVFVFLSE